MEKQYKKAALELVNLRKKQQGLSQKITLLEAERLKVTRDIETKRFEMDEILNRFYRSLEK